jgi:hypothetical protein
MKETEDFQTEAAKGRSSFVGELLSFVANNKKWWLLPIILCLVILTLLALFAGSGAAPFVYTLF